MGNGRTLIGSVVRDHKIIEVLGHGGCGVVYLASHVSLGTKLALKVIDDEGTEDPGVVKRFLREASVLKRLRHPNIVEVVDFGHLSNGWPFLLMELVDGGDLYERLDRSGPMGLEPGLKLLRQVSKVLEYAHAEGVVHRDLKPANLLVNDGDPERIKVIDFGLVKLMSADQLTRLTQTKEIMGSPLYMSPEQASGHPNITGAADIYALSAMAYAVLSGDAVFGLQAPLAAIFSHVRDAPPRLSLRVEIPDRLDDLLFSCLAKVPEARPSAATFTRIVDEVLRELANSPVIEPPDRRDVGLARTEYSAGPTASITVDVPSIGDLIFVANVSKQTDRIREALSRQMLAVINELAESIEKSDSEIAEWFGAVADTESKLEEIELEVALLDADIAAGDSASRIDLESRRTELAARANKLHGLLRAEQRALAELVQAKEASNSAKNHELFQELAKMASRARMIDREATK